MPDRKKVIKRLEQLQTLFEEKDIKQFADDVQDAIVLLKDQETVEPIAKVDDMYECICGAIVGWDELDASGIVQTRFNYCPYCGKAVKWNDK